jgi:hypothetical protein
MNWISDPDRVKVQWRLVWLNVAAVVMNLVIAVVTWRVISIANLASAAFSAWIAWTMYRKIPEITRQQEQRIVDILKGSFDR